MKLKTLKDLKFGNIPGINEKVFFESKLKKEAIKWVKDFHKKFEFANVRTIIWIEKFFNITSEDLE